MNDRRYDLLAIGDAIVDVLAPVDDAFLVRHGLAKGLMRSVDADEADRLQALLPGAATVSGGSAANTAVAAAALGARTAYVGKVRDDAAGRLFAGDLRANGVAFDMPPAEIGPATARCVVLVTPDGERTMNTHLGICQAMTPGDVDRGLVAESAYLLVEGYLWGAPGAQAACEKAVRAARQAGTRVAFTLSDPLCAERNRASFRRMLRYGDIDVLFANKHEIRSLYGTDSADDALDALTAESGALAVVTLSGDGCVLAQGPGRTREPAHPVAAVVDTTGAGDAFSAGFLAGAAMQMDSRVAARLGALVAAHVIGHVGARARTDLRLLAREAGFAV